VGKASVPDRVRFKTIILSSLLSKSSLQYPRRRTFVSVLSAAFANMNVALASDTALPAFHLTPRVTSILGPQGGETV
jgi:hypothetical protein